MLIFNLRFYEVVAASMLGFAKFSPCCNYKFLNVFLPDHQPQAPPELPGIAFAMLSFAKSSMKSKVRFCKVYCIRLDSKTHAVTLQRFRNHKF